jgi:hypothetical protein
MAHSLEAVFPGTCVPAINFVRMDLAALVQIEEGFFRRAPVSRLPFIAPPELIPGESS